MHIDWNKLTGDLLGPLHDLRGGVPDVMKGFSAIAQAALERLRVRPVRVTDPGVIRDIDTWAKSQGMDF